MSEAGATAVTDGASPTRCAAGSRSPLDLDDLVEAHRLAAALRPWFGVVKIGLELYSAAGPDVIGALRDLGYQVFLDLKLFDIPTTVNRATRVLGALGVEYLTLHAPGGVDMLRAGVDGLVRRCRAGADSTRRSRSPSPCSPATTRRRRTSCPTACASRSRAGAAG